MIAAGGIMDGAGIKAALALGAIGVQMGTAFILCPESSATPEHRAALVCARAHETRVTSYVSGRPARGLANRLYLESSEQKSLSQPNIRWLMTWPKHCMPPLFSKAVMILPLNGPGKGRRLHARYLQQN